jgi:DNA-binding GntR family transcriptional regulator
LIRPVPERAAARAASAGPTQIERSESGSPATATARVYEGIYKAIVEHRLAPGSRLREEELAESFAVSRTVVRQALQRLAADHIIELQHNRGAQVPHPAIGQAAHVFDARRVVECDIARRLAGQLAPAQVAALNQLVDAEAAAHARGDKPAAIRVSGQFHRELAMLAGNPVFMRLIDELLPTTSLLIALYQRSSSHAGCVTHRHQELIAALTTGTPARAATEMRRHLTELERSLGGGTDKAPPLRDVFAAYRPT